jgi:uncharacterized protein YydD (DUF2326 family)
MIVGVRSSLPTFKSVKFTKGFNVILAERTKESTKKDSRNGLGKTTLIEIIHFCLGDVSAKNSGLAIGPLLGVEFHLDLKIKGRDFTFSRNTADPGWIGIEGDWSNWPIQPEIDRDSQKGKLKQKDFKKALGYLFFGLLTEISDQKYSPTFGSLSSYFVRKGRDAFSSPFEHHRKQKVWDVQVNNAFLLGLGWQYAQKWQFVKDKEKLLQDLKRSASPDLLPNLMGTIGELETQKVRLYEKIKLHKSQLDAFKVHPQYTEIEEDASSLTYQIHELNNQNFSDRRLLDYFEQSLIKEKPAKDQEIAELYKQAGFDLPDYLVKTLREVYSFHQAVVTNRKSYLEGEISNLKNRIKSRGVTIEKLSNNRAKSMEILKTHGALEEYTQLQQRHLSIISELENLEQRIDNLRQLEKLKGALKIETEQLLLDARLDMSERKNVLESAISLFNRNSEALYELPGNLIVDIDKTGFRFSIEIQRAASQGVEQMKVFCYDLMLAQLWAGKGEGLGFLVHDSTLFDGVDERQVAHALEVAAKSSLDIGFQYICSLNSDLIPETDFSSGFNIHDFVSLTLTDASEDGSLLGFRF